MKIGLVLGGGGARGAYQIGVWKALRELEIDKYINIISGASIGALNAMLYTQGDIQLADKVWNSVTTEKILPTDSINLLKRSFLVSIGSKNMDFIKRYIPKVLDGGNISRSGLENIIDETLDFDLIKSKGMKIYIVCTEIPKIKARYFLINKESNERIKKILHASAAIPMIFESENIDGIDYIDGGIADNVPIEPVYYEKCDLIIVVGLMRGYRVDRNIYSESQILEIIPSEMEEGFIDGALNFTEENSKQRMEVGYNDTINQIKPIINLLTYINNKTKKPSIIESFKDLFKKVQ
ncbi:patatin-like phospholipase family protein [uncultured Clostridium sp.]|uniref:patatin-like phospholipase family protein n=1 Tax=uncultured Clostridium sp. TaxID=59620 RepID=UPI00260F2D36|nr:patatin-like phospholipase family protein [uncultured Clostridium sp.]